MATIALALLGVGVGVAARSAAALPQPPTHSGNQRLLIPAYFEPGPEGERYAKMCQRIRNSLAESLIIMNPYNNGHFTEAEDQYRDGMAACQSRGQSVIGYVDTNYAEIGPNAEFSVDAVKANVDNYFDLYPGIRGIFFDQVPHIEQPGGRTIPFLSAYYRKLRNHVHQRSPSAKVVVNSGPGAHTKWQFKPPIADIVVNFEQSYANFQSWSPKPWTLKYRAARFAHLVYATPNTLAKTKQACIASADKHAGWVYVTPERLGEDLWKVPPSKKMLRCPSLYRRPVVCCRGRTTAPAVTAYEHRKRALMRKTGS